MSSDHWGEVVEKTLLTPSMVRVVLGGPGLDGFVPAPFTDQYVNALFPPDDAPYGVPFDREEVRTLGSAFRPKGRRFTVRRWDADERLLSMDFVTHGDVGFAGRWAAQAQAGDRLQVTGPSGGYAPDAGADWHLMVGDESALPAIAASLEVLPSGSRAVVVAVVDDAAHELPLPTGADLELHWVRRSTDPGASGVLAAIHDLTFPAGRVDAFVHGEAAEVRAVRRHLLMERGVPPEGASISPYWRRGHDDEQWREVKSVWLADAAADVA